MNSALQTVAVQSTELHDCWNRIGVRGDSSCSELTAHIHCRNCPTYSLAARKLLDAPPPSDYSRVWADHFARPIAPFETDSHSVMIFRMGMEWLAVPTSSCVEVVSSRPIHSLPHRRSGAVLGVVNIRGALLVCISLAQILQVAVDDAQQKSAPRMLTQRLLVLRWTDAAAVVPVDEVHGVLRISPKDLQPAPATLTGAHPTYTKAVVRWGERSVGLLNDELLGYMLARVLA